MTGIAFSYNNETNIATYTTPGLLLELRKYVATLTTSVKDVNGFTLKKIAKTTFYTNTTDSNIELPVDTFMVSAKPHVTTVDVSWTKANLAGSNNAITYNVYSKEISTAIDNPFDLVASGITTLSYNDTGKKVDTEYKYAVSANANGQESALMLLNGTVNTVALLDINALPNAFVTVSAGDLTVGLTWPAVTGATAYNLYVEVTTASSAVTNFTLLNIPNRGFEITTANFIHDTINSKLANPSLAVVNGSSYRYKVAAINVNGDIGPQTAIVSDPATPNKLPSITIFEAKPSSVIAGGQTTLKAIFANGTGTITKPNPTGGTPIPIQITRVGTTNTYTATVSPTVVTTYTLNVTNGVTSAKPKTVTVFIRKPGELSFKVSSSRVSETISNATGSVGMDLIVTRTKGIDGLITVQFKVNDVSANIDMDYKLLSGNTISFANGESTKTIPIGVINDGTLTQNQATKSFTVSLSNPTNGATLGASINHTVTIVDNDILSLNYGLKQLQFSWTAYPRDPTVSGTPGDIFYQLWRQGGINPILINGLPTTKGLSVTIEISVHLFNWNNAQYYLKACNQISCVQSNNVSTHNPLPGSPPNSMNAIGYFKANNTGALEDFGKSLALSADGLTLAVGAYGEASHAGTTADPKVGGVINDPAKFPKPDTVTLDFTGAVYLYIRDSTKKQWVQQAYIKASNPDAFDSFGYSVALSADGKTLAVGAYFEGSSSTGINSTPNNLAAAAGAVYVFRSVFSSWTQEAYIKASNAGVGDIFGSSVALSSDGNSLAVGAPYEASHSGTMADPKIGGVINDPMKLPKPDAVQGDDTGAVYLYTRDSTSKQWAQKAYIKAGNPDAGDHFGNSVALNADGSTLVVGAIYEGSSSAGINSTPNNMGVAGGAGPGAVYLFTHKVNIWTQKAYIKASNPDSFDNFGSSVSLDTGGSTLAVGARGEGSNSTGISRITINSTPNNLANGAGAVYLY